MADKIDVLDFIINVLKEHEKELSELVDRLEDLLKETETKKPAQKVVIMISKWEDFKKHAYMPEKVSFKTNEYLEIKAIKNDRIFAYKELIPRIQLRFRKENGTFVIDRISVRELEHVNVVLSRTLKCGLKGTIAITSYGVVNGSMICELSLKFESENVKNWLSTQLSVKKEAVFEGELI